MEDNKTKKSNSIEFKNFKNEELKVKETINKYAQKYYSCIVGAYFDKNSNEPIIHFLMDGSKLDNILEKIPIEVYNKDTNELNKTIRSFIKKHNSIIERICFIFLPDLVPHISFDTKEELNKIQKTNWNK
ncbi:hypothetical protein [Seonamhaeicola sp.]|uniref:hypothetical protein n=1 Tax=Seonamhaeicola sp. TaxID=1912245 RepID=UPI002605F13F|nr:hypothetical protein [Seonamhaeicola sp.]